MSTRTQAKPTLHQAEKLYAPREFASTTVTVNSWWETVRRPHGESLFGKDLDTVQLGKLLDLSSRHQEALEKLRSTCYRSSMFMKMLPKSTTHELIPN